MGDYKWILTYPFETAGRQFRVIDEDTVSVLVPYKKGDELIRQIMEKDGRFHLGEIRRLIREARPYFVYGQAARVPARRVSIPRAGDFDSAGWVL